jgi:hypothetical protein
VTLSPSTRATLTGARGTGFPVLLGPQRLDCGIDASESARTSASTPQLDTTCLLTLRFASKRSAASRTLRRHTPTRSGIGPVGYLSRVGQPGDNSRSSAVANSSRASARRSKRSALCCRSAWTSATRRRMMPGDLVRGPLAGVTRASASRQLEEATLQIVVAEFERLSLAPDAIHLLCPLADAVHLLCPLAQLHSPKLPGSGCDRIGSRTIVRRRPRTTRCDPCGRLAPADAPAALAEAAEVVNHAFSVEPKARASLTRQEKGPELEKVRPFRV